MTHSDGDLRVRRTRKMIQDALISLIEERGFDQISVGDIAERAMVNRATFYRHYEDKYDLTMKIFEDAMERLKTDIRNSPRPPRDPLDPLPRPDTAPVIQLFEHFASHSRFYQAMLGTNGSSWFADKIRNYFKGHLTGNAPSPRRTMPRRPNKTSPDLPDDLAIAIGADMFISSVMWWINTGCRYPAEQVIAWIGEIALHGFVYAMGYELPAAATTNHL